MPVMIGVLLLCFCTFSNKYLLWDIFV